MKINTMGNKVVHGHKCKPINLDPNRPIMHFKTQVFLCDGGRCKSVSRDDLADNLRELIRSMGLNNGENRIKITRTKCFGACRFKQVAQIIENTKRNGFAPNNNIWLKNVHLFDTKRWQELFLMLAENKKIDESDFEQIDMQEI